MKLTDLVPTRLCAEVPLSTAGHLPPKLLFATSSSQLQQAAILQNFSTRSSVLNHQRPLPLRVFNRLTHRPQQRRRISSSDIDFDYDGSW